MRGGKRIKKKISHTITRKQLTQQGNKRRAVKRKARKPSKRVNRSNVVLKASYKRKRHQSIGSSSNSVKKKRKRVNNCLHKKKSLLN